jgi:hypothetical protein
MNIGLWRRLRIARSTAPLPRMGSGGGGTDHDVRAMEVFRHGIEGDGFRMEAVAERMCPFHGAVGDDDMADAVADEVAQRQLDGLAGADDQRGQGLQVTEDLPRERHRREGHGNGAGADGGRCADVLRRGKGVLKQPFQRQAQGAGGMRMLVGALHLPEDLRLAEHHGVEAAGDTKGVQHRLVVVMSVQVGLEFVALDSVESAKPVQHALLTVAALLPEVDLRPVAGGEDRGLGIFTPLCRESSASPSCTSLTASRSRTAPGPSCG